VTRASIYSQVISYLRDSPGVRRVEYVSVDVGPQSDRPGPLDADFTFGLGCALTSGLTT